MLYFWWKNVTFWKRHFFVANIFSEREFWCHHIRFDVHWEKVQELLRFFLAFSTFSSYVCHSPVPHLILSFLWVTHNREPTTQHSYWSQKLSFHISELQWTFKLFIWAKNTHIFSLDCLQSHAWAVKLCGTLNDDSKFSMDVGNAGFSLGCWFHKEGFFGIETRWRKDFWSINSSSFR